MAKRSREIQVIAVSSGKPVPSFFYRETARKFLEAVESPIFLEEYAAWEKTPEAQRLLKYCGCLD